MNVRENTGKVVLAGAGPGDPELITLKLLQRLAVADVIVCDRLVNPAIIEAHAKKDVQVILAGKQGYNADSFTQQEVSLLIVEHALQGKNVLRLKGGDIAFFSNVLDELIALEQNNIPYEIIPGITAASGASAFAGIPLTARGFSQAVQFITYNPNSYYSPERWKELARSNDTLVFYMASRNIGGLAELLLRYSRKPQTAIAVIEQATTKYQKVHVSTLDQCVKEFTDKNFASPSLVIVGDVVNLHKKFNWFNNNEDSGTVFNELLSK
ncbi:MAG TPA: uroporphyrinogen-III C-methyltransferase [Chitinophagaceae bacterium]|jgi:uroporphyrin-III C-methyltransferase|nr:uroporphyrinogen-III C-methyltransferase [Chitinophagaceae bacterium]